MIKQKYQKYTNYDAGDILEEKMIFLLHDLVEDYCNDWCGEETEIPYLHEEIDHPNKRTERFDLFMEYIKDNDLYD